MFIICGRIKSTGESRMDIRPPEGRKIFLINDGVRLKRAEKIITELERNYVDFVYPFTGFPIGVGFESVVRKLGGTWSTELAPEEYFRLYCFPFMSGYLSVAYPWQGNLQHNKHDYQVSYHGRDNVTEDFESRALSFLKTLLKKSRKTDKYGYECFPKNKRYEVDPDIFLQESELFSPTWVNSAEAMSAARMYRLFAFPQKHLVKGWNVSLWIDFYPDKEDAILAWNYGGINFPQYRIYANDKRVLIVNKNKNRYLTPKEIFAPNFLLKHTNFLTPIREAWKEAGIYRARKKQGGKGPSGKENRKEAFWKLIKTWVEFI